MVAIPTEQPATIEERVAEVATQVGEEVNRVRRYRLRVNHMRKLGVLVDLDVHGFSMFTRRVRWVELGIPAGDARSRQFTSGSKYLIPRAYVRRLNSLDTDGFRPYRWVSYKAYPKWKAEVARLREKLSALKAEIVEEYPQIKADMAVYYTEVAHKVWEANVTRPGGSTGDALDMGEGLVFAGRDALVEHIVGRALTRLPTPEEIKGGIYVTYRTAAMLSAADVEEDHLAAELFRTATARQAAETAYYDEQAEAGRRVAREEEEAEKRVIGERERAQQDLIRAEVKTRELECFCQPN